MMLRSRDSFWTAVLILLLASFPAFGVTYTPSPAGYANGGVITMAIDTSKPQAIVKKSDGYSFQKAGTMRLYQNGVQIGATISYAQQSQVLVPFAWNFTSGSRSFYAKASSSDGSVFQSGTVTVTAATPTIPQTSSASVTPTSGTQTSSLFSWQAFASNADGQSFSMTAWILQPSGAVASFGMTPTSTNWKSGVTFTFQKNLISAGDYSFYVVASTAGGTSRFPLSGYKSGPSTSFLVLPRMSGSVTHVGVHLYRNNDLTRLRQHLQLIRSTIPNTAYTTCFQGTKKAQLSVQLEFSFADYVADPLFMQHLDDAVNAALKEGFAVHLLLSVHDPISSASYGGYTWARDWPGTSTFVPYQPAKERGSGQTTCRYDVISDLFHKPVLQHLMANQLVDKLADIFLLNELDYRTAYSKAETWPNCTTTPQQCRDEALVYTTNRLLGAARSVVGSRVPLGVKLPATNDYRSALRVPAAGQPDQLAWLLGTAMAPNGYVLGYDAYWGTNLYDDTNFKRLLPFLGSFTGGRLELSEYGHVCEGDTCSYTTGARTTASELSGVVGKWYQAAGFNLFAFNATGKPGGCYAIYNSATGSFCTAGGTSGIGGKTQLTNVGEQIKAVTGGSTQPCQ